MAQLTGAIRETVRQKYAQTAQATAAWKSEQTKALRPDSGCGGSNNTCCTPADQTGVFGRSLWPIYQYSRVGSSTRDTH